MVIHAPVNPLVQVVLKMKHACQVNACVHRLANVLREQCAGQTPAGMRMDAMGLAHAVQVRLVRQGNACAQRLASALQERCAGQTPAGMRMDVMELMLVVLERPVLRGNALLVLQAVKEPLAGLMMAVAASVRAAAHLVKHVLAGNALRSVRHARHGMARLV